MGIFSIGIHKLRFRAINPFYLSPTGGWEFIFQSDLLLRTLYARNKFYEICLHLFET